MLGIASVPAGRLVDRGNHLRVLAAAMACWSLMTVVSGLSTGLSFLLACRLGVALGQAALNPACYALIADRVPASRLGLAFGIFGMAGHVGIGVANLIGAAILALIPPHGLAVPMIGLLQPWQLTLVLVGAPGIALAMLLLLTDKSQARGDAEDARLPVAIVVRFFRDNIASFGLLKLASGFAAMALYGIAGWSAALLVRNHGWTPVGAGAALGPTFLVAGALGALVGGVLGDRLHRRRRDGRIVVMMLATLTAAPFGACAPLQSRPLLLVALLGGTILFASMAIAINPGATMAMMPARMRGVAAALGVLIVNFVGLGCGPLAIALLTDNVFADPRALPLSMALATGVSLIVAAGCAQWCRRPYERSMRTLHGTWGR
jgi:MFS family permease